MIVLAEANTSEPPCEDILGEERRVLGSMVDEGFAIAGYREENGTRVILILVAASLEEASARLQALPMVADGILNFNCMSVLPLRYL